jgi:hypothetical protein
VEVLRGRRLASAVLCAGLAVGTISCDGRTAEREDDRPFHPGEADRARSAQAGDEVLACARDRGWHLGDLEILVDGEGLLIRIEYRARNLVPGALESEVVDACLTRANVKKPPAA